MKLERTNLLPPQRIRASHRNYFMRLGVISILAVILLVIINGIFLLPAFIYLEQKVAASNSELTHLSSILGTTGQQDVQTKLQALAAETVVLEKLAHTSSASASITSVLEVAHPGIRIIGFTYTAPIGTTPGNLEVTGVATTRETLRNYAQVLGTLPFVKSTDLPISVYAQESNIPFTIGLTGTASSS